MLDLSEFLPAYRAEASGLLDALEADLLELETHPDDRAALQRAFRAAHSLKGGAAMLELHDMQALTHSLENLLDAARGGSPAAALYAPLLEAVDLLRALLERARPTERGDPEVAAMLGTLDRAVSGPPTSPPLTAAPIPVLPTPVLPIPAPPVPVPPPTELAATQPAATVACPVPALPLALLCEPAELAAQVLQSQLERLGYRVERRPAGALLPPPPGVRLVLAAGCVLTPALQAQLHPATPPLAAPPLAGPLPSRPLPSRLCAVSEDPATRTRLAALGVPAHPRPPRGSPLPPEWTPGWRPGQPAPTDPTEATEAPPGQRRTA